jgi:hypothetical protein
MKKAALAASHSDSLGSFSSGIRGQARMLAIEEIKDHVPEESLVAASGMIFPVQNLHIKMMRIKTSVCNQFTTSSSPARRALGV